jgi:hypothetical protein
MRKLLRLIKRIKLESWLSIVAILISVFVLYDTTLRSKLDVSVGKQVKLFVLSIDKNSMQPSISLNMAFINLGGKALYLDDIKLKVDFIEGTKRVLSLDFLSVREFNNSIFDETPKALSEINPLVILGRTSTSRKYLFYPSKLIRQDQLPNIFNLDIRVYTKQSGKWTYNECVFLDDINIWQDIDSTIHKSYIKDILR